MHPKISCLCVTKHRVVNLKTAVACFKAQTYPNKELFIVFPEDDRETEHYVQSLHDPEIRFHTYSSSPRKLTLGQIRNMSIRESDGEYFCLWDDDDWYHQDRLEWQMKHALTSGKMASVLLFIIIRDNVYKKSYLSAPRPWEGTVLCNRHFALNNQAAYDSLDRGEDTGFIEKLVAMDAVCPVIRPQLYVYNCTGNNTWDRRHFEMVFSHAQLLPYRSTLLLSEALSCDSIVEGSNIIDSGNFTDSILYRNFLNRFLKNPQAPRPRVSER